MSRKIVKRKTAVFSLEPDGFSVHTFGLSRKVKQREYLSIKDALYREQEDCTERGWMYEDKESGGYVCTRYSSHGIRIQLKKGGNGDIGTYFIRMQINPRKLIDPQSSYLGILPPMESSVEKIVNAFAELLERSPFEKDINAYQLRRVDLCTNIRCDNRKLFRELVRVLRKLPTPQKYKRCLYKCQDKKKANRYNKHYLRFHCGTHELVIYDKVFQLRENKLVIGYEKLPEGVLRFEVQYKRAYLRKIEEEAGNSCTTKLLWRLICESEGRMIGHFSLCFSDVSYAHKEELVKIICHSHYRKETKSAMLRIVELLQRIQSVDKAMERMRSAGFDTSNLLDKFDKLGVSPVPLWQNFCADHLPGPVELLKRVSGGDVAVEYHKVKYK